MKRIRRGVKTRWLLIIALCLLCWTSISAPNYNAIECHDKIIYAIFEDRFTETIEVMYFLMDDMKVYKLTSNEENRIRFNMWELKEDFKQSGHEISNIIVIIHNHERHAYFSNDDIIVYKTFRGEGFGGKFYP